jgi:hypothetical protein
MSCTVLGLLGGPNESMEISSCSFNRSGGGKTRFIDDAPLKPRAPVAVGGREFEKECSRTRGFSDRGALLGFAPADREDIVLDLRSLGPVSLGERSGLLGPQPGDGIGVVGAGLGVKKDGVSRPDSGSKLLRGLMMGAGLGDLDRIEDGRVIRGLRGAGRGAMNDFGCSGWSLQGECEGIMQFPDSVLSSRNTVTTCDSTSSWWLASS